MGIEEIPEDHIGASITRNRLAESSGEGVANQFESRYTELLDQGASKFEAESIAAGEIMADRGEQKAERIGDGFASIDGLHHEMEQWREQAGVSQFDEF
jgi:hypothetical protein